jgi:hypothetical protein
MRTLRFAAICLAVLVAGCRANNSTVLLERDLRMQEDKIYQLQACLDDAQAAREATIRENEALKQELAGGDRGPGPSGPPARGGADVTPPSVELPGAETSPTPDSPKEIERPDLAPPTIELPEPGATPPTTTPPGAGQTIIESPPTQLVINKRLTGGLDRDGHNGDEGILVVFEPRDAAGHLVKWPGKVSVVLMDPSLEGEAARVARWDFSAAEVPGHFLSTVFGRGLQFELPWPAAPPRNRELQLFVRFTTQEGQKLTADTTIEVRPPGDAPPPDRQTKRSTEGRSDDSSKERAPRSRLKARAPSSNAPRATRAPVRTDSAQSSADGEDADDYREEPPRQATRPERPQWKPYR